MISVDIKKLLIAIMLTVTLQGVTISYSMANEIVIKPNTVWSEIGRIVGFLLNKCLLSNLKNHNQLHRNDNAAVILEDCLKRRGLRALDRALSRDVIAITDNVVLVKWKNDTEVDDKNDRALREENWKTSKSLKVATNDWDRAVIGRLVSFLKTRVVKISFKGFNGSIVESEGRHRNKNNAFGQMMMFGLVAAGLIVIPLGFQFLAVLGGKALLLAKLALLLSSIQGLKKIATSHVNYGLYSTGHGTGPCKNLFDWSQLLGEGGFRESGLDNYGQSFNGDTATTYLYSGEGLMDGDGVEDDDDDVYVSLDADAETLVESNLKWNYDHQWHHDGDPYHSSFYPTDLGTPIVEHHMHSSALPSIYSSLHPRGEDSLSNY